MTTSNAIRDLEHEVRRTRNLVANSVAEQAQPITATITLSGHLLDRLIYSEDAEDRERLLSTVLAGAKSELHAKLNARANLLNALG